MNECKEEGKEKRKGKNRRLGEREGGGGRGWKVVLFLLGFCIVINFN